MSSIIAFVPRLACRGPRPSHPRAQRLVRAAGPRVPLPTAVQ